MYMVYILKSDKYSYVGMTNNFLRRYRQHNKLLMGGAKYTSKRDYWYPICIIDGFANMKEAMQCEWAVKHMKKINGNDGPKRRILNLNILLTKDKWTSKSPRIDSQKLIIYIDEQYKYDLVSKNINIRELYWR